MLKQALIRQLLRFGVVGAVVMAVFMAMNAGLARWFSPTWAFIVAYPPALVLHYFLNKRWTFDCERTDSARQLSQYLFMVGVTFVIQYGFFWLAHDRLGLAGWIAAGIANLAQMAVSFSMMRLSIFAPVPTGRTAPSSGGGLGLARFDPIAVGMAAATIWFLWWTLSTGAFDPNFRKTQGDYYNRLVDGFVDGHLYMKIAVPPELLKMQNPYDPAERKGLGAHDLSYYQGHYYLYFGLTPAVVLFLPYRLLVGSGLPAPMAHWIFCSIGCCAAAGFLGVMRRRYFPEASRTTEVLAGLAAGLAGFTLALLRRPDFWELPIASGFCFLMLFFYFFARGTAEGASWQWLAAASASYGLAIGSRPTYVFGAIALGLPLLQAWWFGRSQGKWRWWPGRPWWQLLAVVSVPVGTVVSGLLLYNYLRFDNPLEFGLKYQFTGIYQLKMRLFSPQFVHFNAWVYFLAPAQWSLYFPFVKMIHSPGSPAGYYGIEFVHGLWRNMPISILALGLPVAVWGVAKAWRSYALLPVLALMTVAGATTGFLLGFNTAAARYMVDFSPTHFLAAGVVALAIDQTLASRRRWRSWSRGVLWAGLIWAVFFGVMASISIHGLFRYWHPDDYVRLATWWNRPVHWMEAPLGVKHGPIELKLKFPAGKYGKWEPLLVSGWEYEADYVAVIYEPEYIRIGFDHTNHTMAISRELAIDYRREHVVRVNAGFLYPPVGHPLYSKLSGAEQAALKHSYQIYVDGILVLDGITDFYDADSWNLSVGVNTAGDAYGVKFTGKIISVSRPGTLEDCQEATRLLTPTTGRRGAITMALQLDKSDPFRPEPLIVTGRTGSGNALFLQYLDEKTARIGYDHWGIGAWYSPPFAINFERIHRLVLDMGSLHVGPADRPEKKTAPVVVRLDGHEIWRQELPFFPSELSDINIGRNPIGCSTCFPDFSCGRISGVEFMRDAEEGIKGK